MTDEKLKGQATTNMGNHFEEGLAKQVAFFGQGMAERQTNGKRLIHQCCVFFVRIKSET